MAGNTGLVLEGGAFRGMYTTGVLDYLHTQGIRFDGIMGCSAGALFGPNFVSGQLGRALRYNKRYTSDPRYMGLRSLLTTGNIVNTEFAYYRVTYELDPFDNEAFKQAGIPYYAVITNMLTGKAEYRLITDVFEQLDVLRASGSMPFVSQPVMLEGTPYLDGGIADSIPFQAMAQRGYDKLVVILTRDLSYRKKPSNPLLNKAVYGRKYPAIAQRMDERHAVYNASVELLEHWEREGRAFVIRPSEPITIGRMESDPNKLQHVYNLGNRDGAAILEDLRAYFAR